MCLIWHNFVKFRGNWTRSFAVASLLSVVVAVLASDLVVVDVSSCVTLSVFVAFCNLTILQLSSWNCQSRCCQWIGDYVVKCEMTAPFNHYVLLPLGRRCFGVVMLHAVDLTVVCLKALCNIMESTGNVAVSACCCIQLTLCGLLSIVRRRDLLYILLYTILIFSLVPCYWSVCGLDMVHVVNTSSVSRLWMMSCQCIGVPVNCYS